MSEEDYKAGQRGLDYSPGMDRERWEAGKSVHDQKEAILRGVPSQQGPGIPGGFGTIILLPYLLILYPLASLVAIGVALAGYPLMRLTRIDFMIQMLLLAGVGAIAFCFALRLERAASKFLPYRLVRWLFRFVVLIGGKIAYGIYAVAEGPAAAPDATDGNAVFALILGAFICWISTFVDKFLGMRKQDA